MRAFLFALFHYLCDQREDIRVRGAAFFVIRSSSHEKIVHSEGGVIIHTLREGARSHVVGLFDIFRLNVLQFSVRRDGDEIIRVSAFSLPDDLEDVKLAVRVERYIVHQLELCRKVLRASLLFPDMNINKSPANAFRRVSRPLCARRRPNGRESRRLMAQPDAVPPWIKTITGSFLSPEPAGLKMSIAAGTSSLLLYGTSGISSTSSQTIRDFIEAVEEKHDGAQDIDIGA